MPLLSAQASASTAAALKVQTVRAAPFENIVQHAVANDDFRGAVLVAQRGRILHAAAYGPADAAAGRANQIDTRFLIGSLTKSFTAIAVLQQAEQGKLDLHRPIGHYLPGLRKDLGEQLTLHLLLKHQSGLPTHLERVVEQAERPISSGEILRHINASTLQFAPGSQYEYGNLGYHLAALVLEQVSGRDYPSVLQQQIFAPSGMSRSGVERFGQRPAERANGYAKSLLGISQDENNVSWALGAGDIYATVHDVFRWDQALHQHTLLKPASTALLFAPESEARGNYGYGFRIQPYQRAPGPSAAPAAIGTLVRHGGSMDGFLSNYHRYLDDELTVIVLGNIRPFAVRDLTFALKEAALGVSPGQRERDTLE
ncbi:MAG TPA: serine hydrolase domain-containing protein [Permianibacter sp.]|nr:serine hydrolase domain-containing protein [Permianibacter sp.]